MAFITTTDEHIASGGTITGDLTISGDLTVSGDSSGAYSEIITDGLQITKDTDGEFVSLILVNESDAADTTGIISQRFDLEDTGGTAVDSGKILVGKEASFTATASTQDSYMAFQTSLNGALAEKVRITSAGNVGIGNIVPGSMLEISKVSGQPSLELSAWSASATKGHAGVLKFQKSGTATVNTFTAGDHTTAGEILGRIEAYGVDDNDGSTLSSYIEFANDAVSDADSSPGKIIFATSDADDAGSPTVAMTIDDSQNVGIGVVPEASHASYTSVQIGGLGNIINTTSQAADSYTALANNAYIDATPQWEYIVTDEASLYKQTAGIHTFSSAASGSADAAITFTDVMKLDVNSRISLSNNDASGAVGTTLLGYNAGLSIVSGAINNTFIGHAVSDATMTNAADNNTGVGYIALGSLTSGNANTSIGSGSLKTITTGSENIAIGFQSAQSFGVAETGNISIGANSMNSMDEGTNGNVNYNIAIGLESFLGGNINTASTDVIGNVAIGAYALDATSTNAQTGTIAIGHQALTALTSGAGNVAVGYQSGTALTTGERNTILGYTALDAGTTETDDNVAIGYNAMGGAIGTEAVNDCVAVGADALSGALDSTNGADEASGTVAIGKSALAALKDGAGNVAMGHNAGASLTTGERNIILGHKALYQGTTETDDNVAIGFSAMSGGFSTAAVNDCISIGSLTLDGVLTSTASGSIAIGYSALTALTSGAGNTAVGHQALMTEDTGPYSTAIGHSALKIQNNANGMNTAVGYNSQISTAGGSSNTSVGHLSMQLIGGSSGGNNVAIGANSMKSSGTITDNVAANNVAVGADSLLAITIGQRNTAIGSAAGDSITDANDCVLIGKSAGATMTVTNSGTSDGTVAVGTSALTALTWGYYNTAVGFQAGNALTTGIDNTILGYNSDVSASGSANQTVIGSRTTGVADNSVTLGNADVTRVNMSFDGAAVMYADGTINTSDRRFKENIEDTDLGLSFINSLRPVKYNFIEDKHDGKTKYGIIAQEVIEVLNETGNMDFAGIKDDNKEKLGADYIQFVAPLIKAIQELTAKVEALEAK